jgi:hypothetical protein
MRPIGHYTQADQVLGDQPGLFDLPQGGKQLLMILNLLPTEQMDKAGVVHQVEAKALGFTPMV